ncbi:hypothetical protein [Leptospira kmetyi]|uniref:hypothetical protein n=1 Tax=Leptospira kmetyi TaxID=408139 RepID=UPI0002896A6E|nr:hypothetical protein [Leptospira kmetyi]EQA55334.1 hypothetical protein LEP1GSC052_3735 [Leptospira kmetyi serovar Malaysia str. Bejo-Iso9]
MEVNRCSQCAQRDSMRQTDLCEECLIKKFKPLISLSDKIRSLHLNATVSSIQEEPKGAA